MMRKLYFIGIVFLFLLSACTEKDAMEPNNEQKIVDENPNIDPQEKEPKKDTIETTITNDDAKKISKEVVQSFMQLMRDLGEEHQWNFENPGVYEVAKEDLLTVATESFADERLKNYVEEYYCNCDSGWYPALDDRTIRLEVTDITENSFSVNGIVLPDLVKHQHKLSMKFVHEEDGWKIDHWEEVGLTGVNLNLTEDEIIQAHPDGKIIGEYETNQGIPAYKVQLPYETLGISKNDGEFLFIE